MQGKYKFSSLLMGIVLLAFTVFIAVISMTVMYSTKTAYTAERDAVRVEIERFEKAQLEVEAGEIIEYAKASRANGIKAMRMELQERVENAYILAEYIYASNKDRLSDSQIEAEIASALRDIRYDEGQGYFFMDRFDGEVMLYPVKPEQEGQNVLDLVDNFGNFVVRDEINLAKNFGEGFVEGHWAMPGAMLTGGELKVSYVRRFRDFDWYIGTGIYENAFMDALQYKVLEDLKALEDEKYAYYISDETGKLIFENGQLVLENRSLSGDMLALGMQSKQGDFVKESGFDDENKVLKISYVKPIEAWDWILGIKVTLDESYADRKAYYLKQTEQNLNLIIVITGFVLFMLTAFMLILFTGRVNRCFAGIHQVIDGDCHKEKHFYFEEFAKIAQRITEKTAKDALPVMSVCDPKPLTKEVNTLVEGEVVAAQAVHEINLMAECCSEDAVDKKKLTKIGANMAEIRKLLFRLSHDGEKVLSPVDSSDFETIHLKVFIQEIMTMILSEYHNVNIDFGVFCDSDLIVESDTMVFTQILTHLTTNAVEHGFTDMEEGSITIEVIYDDDYLRIYFSDNGAGMHADVQERIFEPYYSTTSLLGSAGMGLAEVFALVQDKLGGAINVSSREGYGTDFFMDIPGVGPGLYIIAPYDATALKVVHDKEYEEIS